MPHQYTDAQFDKNNVLGGRNFRQKFKHEGEIIILYVIMVLNNSITRVFGNMKIQTGELWPPPPTTGNSDYINFLKDDSREKFRGGFKFNK